MQQEIMRTGNTVNFSITLTKNMAETVDRICRTEERNRSELVRLDTLWHNTRRRTV